MSFRMRRNIDGYIREHDFAAPSLSDYPEAAAAGKGFERLRVRGRPQRDLWLSDLYRLRNPSRNKVLQIAFAMPRGERAGGNTRLRTDRASGETKEPR